MIISAIVATDRKGTIGKAGEIPWYLPADFKYFRRTTTGHPIIMGRKTFESIGRPLPKRTNIVLTRDSFYVSSGIVVTHSLEDALAHDACQEAEEVFIIGGGEIYKQAMPFVQRVYLTTVATEIEGGDAFFPDLDPKEWEVVWMEDHPADEKNKLDFRFSRWERVS